MITMKTKITELLGIKYPIIQGGMAWVADAELAAAVSNAGGLGLIAAANAPCEIVKAEIRKAKTLTDKPFGVNIMLMSPSAPEIAQLMIDEDIKVITTGAGNPGKYMEMWNNAGIKVIPVVPSVALAKRMERSGASAVIAEGTEAGGHIGELTTMALLPQVVDAVEIPVLGAGGVGDERGLAAMFMLGAQGAQIGTLFLASNECNIHENYKRLVVEAKDTDSAVTGRGTGHPVRSIRNKYTRRINDMEKSDVSVEELEAALAGSLRKAARDGDLEGGAFMAGQIAGMITEIRPVKQILDEIMTKTEVLIKSYWEETQNG